MQLLLLLALLMMGGNNNGLLSEVKPLLQNFGDENLKEVLGEVQSLREVIGAVKVFMPEKSENIKSAANQEKIFEASEEKFPFAAVSSFADKDIVCALSGYLAR